MTLDDMIEQAVNAVDWGTPFARKGGRDHRWPWVPVMRYHTGGKAGDGYTRQLQGLAYATRDEAIAACVRYVSDCQATLRRELAVPNYRALREWHGLPRELSEVA